MSQEPLPVWDWKEYEERLRVAETVEDFVEIRTKVPSITHTTLQCVNSPVVLRAYLQFFQPAMEMLISFFYVAAYRHRVDLMDVFFERITLSDLSSSDPRADRFSIYLMRTIEKGVVDVVVFFLEKCMDVNAPLPRRSENMLVVACYHSKVDVVDLLIERSADVNSSFHTYVTPLNAAMLSHDVNVLDRLIVQGVDLRYRNKDGNNVWKSVSWTRYTVEMKPNFQRIAGLNVPVDEHVYKAAVEASRSKPVLRGLVAIMREVMQKQGNLVEG